MSDSELSGIYNYRYVSPQLHTAGQPTADQIAGIARAGCTVVINLGLHDADYALPDERALVEAQGMVYVHIPVRWEGPTQHDLARFSRVLAEYEGQTLFVHCAANVRVSVFVALHRALCQGWAAEDALGSLDLSRLPPVWRRFIADRLAGASPDAGEEA